MAAADVNTGHGMPDGTTIGHEAAPATPSSFDPTDIIQRITEVDLNEFMIAYGNTPEGKKAANDEAKQRGAPEVFNTTGYGGLLAADDPTRDVRVLRARLLANFSKTKLVDDKLQKFAQRSSPKRAFLPVRASLISGRNTG
jgi:hypothetical protein